MFEPEREAGLMARVKTGDRAAFEELFHLYAGAIAKFFYHLTWDRQAVEDGVQEVFLRLWRGARHWQPTGKFSTYLFQIAKNYWINERAKQARRIRPVPLRPTEARGEDVLEEYASDPGPGPEGVALQREMADEIQDAVSSLPEKLKLTFVLSEYQGLKYAEVAEILGIPVGTVKSRMSAAEKALRQKLKKYSH
ncbi:MAG: RNA polymerase sigma factor [Planctomycetota bacterium]|jgi:RNA polymerase sigma-70 factor (ECF subfamily)